MNNLGLITLCLFFVSTPLSAAPIKVEDEPSPLPEKILEEVWSSDNELSKILSQLTSAETSEKFFSKGPVHLNGLSLKQTKEDLKKFSSTIVTKLADGDLSLGQDGYNNLLHAGDEVDFLVYLVSIGALQHQNVEILSPEWDEKTHQNYNVDYYNSDVKFNFHSWVNM